MTQDEYIETVEKMTDKELVKESIIIQVKKDILDCEINSRRIYRGPDGKYIRVKEEVIE